MRARQTYVAWRAETRENIGISTILDERLTAIGDGRTYTINAGGVSGFAGPLGHVDPSVAPMIGTTRVVACRRMRPGHEIAALRLCMPDDAPRSRSTLGRA